MRDLRREVLRSANEAYWLLAGKRTCRSPECGDALRDFAEHAARAFHRLSAPSQESVAVVMTHVARKDQTDTVARRLLLRRALWVVINDRWTGASG